MVHATRSDIIRAQKYQPCSSNDLFHIVQVALCLSEAGVRCTCIFADGIGLIDCD